VDEKVEKANTAIEKKRSKSAALCSPMVDQT